MDLATFRTSLEGDGAPKGLPAALRALWFEARGDWHRAHALAQSRADAAGAWVHAYLHRVEGDNANAGYWYRKAGKTPSTKPFKAEWEEIAAALLDKKS